MTNEEADKIKAIMQERDEDNGGEPLNAVDRGYHLACVHLCEELDKLIEQEPKTDIRECGSCKYSKDGHMAGTEECHECMWESKQEPKTDILTEIEKQEKWLLQAGYSQYNVDIVLCTIKSLLTKQEPKTDYKAFAEWVAEEIFSDEWEYNKNSFAEIACRKLAKLGLVKAEDDNWVLKESEDKDNGICSV